MIVDLKANEIAALQALPVTILAANDSNPNKPERINEKFGIHALYKLARLGLAKRVSPHPEDEWCDIMEITDLGEQVLAKVAA